jgi:hypothetical protein
MTAENFCIDCFWFSFRFLRRYGMEKAGYLSAKETYSMLATRRLLQGSQTSIFEHQFSFKQKAF